MILNNEEIAVLETLIRWADNTNYEDPVCLDEEDDKEEIEVINKEIKIMLSLAQRIGIDDDDLSNLRERIDKK